MKNVNLQLITRIICFKIRDHLMINHIHGFHNHSEPIDMKNFDQELKSFLNDNQHYLVNDSSSDKNSVLDDLVSLAKKKFNSVKFIIF